MLKWLTTWCDEKQSLLSFNASEDFWVPACLIILIEAFSYLSLLRGEKKSMTSKPSPKPPYTFRAGWALALLALNFVVAAYYFGILK